MFDSRKGNRFGRVEERLRAERPQASSELVRAVSRRVGVRPTGVPRIALAGAMTALMLVALGSVGGISYAANAANGALKAVKKAVAPQAGRQAIVLQGISAGGDQYRPGFGFGDPNHNHTGPPGLQRQGGEAAPPLRARPTPDGKARLVGTTVTFDEQAALFISVIDANGRELLLTQQSKRGGSRIGAGIEGRQTKFIRYTLLVPRAVPFQLRIPANLLKAGQQYSMRIVAIDPAGNKSTLLISFSV